ncbi:hypothetical protein [Helicobacter ailurogastricus]|uniref:hypothetical protein n=1 Tax=Helicobacter ailurogastricus TaxID=1578720 RepID=UPI0006B4550E|nr:hypothetical protein [Helicobacter ailurogastricus]
MFYFIYVLVALTPAWAIFYLHTTAFSFLKLACILLGAVGCALFSYFYMRLIEKHIPPSDKMRTVEMVEVAEPKYIPIYIAYFVIAVSFEHCKEYKIFIVVFILIYLLILKGKFSYFNPYLLFFGYHFYEISIDLNKTHGQNYAKFKVFLISKRTLKEEMQYSKLIRLNDFVFLDKEKE